MIVWKSPEAFLLLGLLFGLGFWLWLKRSKRATFQFSSLSTIALLPRSLRSRLADLPLVLVFLALIGLIVCLARPQQADTKIKRNIEGIDIMITLDISDSMLIEDMLPENRLESSKSVIQGFIKGRVSDRIGLVVFSGEAYTRVPLTLDYPLLLQSVAQIQTTRAIKMGTAIGVALATAVGRIKDSSAKTRTIIFLTDGENNSGTIDPETALEIAKKYNIRVYSIGMGKDGQAQLPVILEDASGRQIKRYRPIHSQVNDALLTRMATETGGKYWRATTSDALKEVFEKIDSLEKTRIEINQYTKYTDLFQKYLVFGLGFYALALVLGITWLRRGPL